MTKAACAIMPGAVVMCIEEHMHVDLRAMLLTARCAVMFTLEALISRFRLADHRVAMGSPVAASTQMLKIDAFCCAERVAGSLWSKLQTCQVHYTSCSF